jgi:Mrp family chromosome partitioning ATPase
VGDGQSTIALNLAIAASQQSKKVLFVDANWQNSPTYPWLNLQNEKGLSNLLQQEISLESVLQVSPDYPHLFLLSSGPKLRTKHLWSNHFQYCRSEFQAHYDLVIYDLPPFLDNTDIYFISTYSDGLIFTIGVKKTPQTLAKEVARAGITVNSILPGYIETDALTEMNDDARKLARQGIPMRRFGTPRDVAAAVFFLACQDASYITGSALKIDGGIF